MGGDLVPEWFKWWWVRGMTEMKKVGNKWHWFFDGGGLQSVVMRYSSGMRYRFRCTVSRVSA